jgi:predicted nucleic acid-binding protein
MRPDARNGRNLWALLRELTRLQPLLHGTALTCDAQRTSLGARVEARLFGEDDELRAPRLLDVEIARGLRRLVRTGKVSSGRAEEAIADLTDLDVHRHAHLDLLDRAWRLRGNISAYDTMYVALAEAIAAPIVTCDGPLTKAPGHRARIEVIV